MKKEYSVGRFLAIGWIALSASLAQAEELELPEININLNGFMADRALHEALLEKNIPIVIGNYKPIQKTWEWKQTSLSQNSGTTQFSFLVQRINGEDEAPAEEDTTEEDSGVWGYFSSVKTLLQKAAFYFMNAKISGDVTTETYACPAPFDSNGYRVKVDLRQSSPVIYGLATDLSIRVCVQKIIDSEHLEAAKVKLSLGVTPGKNFPGLEDSYVQDFLTAQEQAWITALTSSTYVQQAQLVKQHFIKN